MTQVHTDKDTEFSEGSDFFFKSMRQIVPEPGVLTLGPGFSIASVLEGHLQQHMCTCTLPYKHIHAQKQTNVQCSHKYTCTLTLVHTQSHHTYLCACTHKYYMLTSYTLVCTHSQILSTSPSHCDLQSWISPTTVVAICLSQILYMGTLWTVIQ